MAEFVQMMKDWKRMCNAMEQEDEYSACDKCKLESFGCPAIYEVKCNSADWNHVESVVTAWAAEHPEPVYETWFEWLEGQGVTAIINGEPYYDSMDREIYLKQPAFTPKAFDHIPADIAQKLGIEPKEG